MGMSSSSSPSILSECKQRRPWRVCAYAQIRLSFRRLAMRYVPKIQIVCWRIGFSHKERYWSDGLHVIYEYFIVRNHFGEITSVLYMTRTLYLLICMSQYLLQSESVFSQRKLSKCLVLFGLWFNVPDNSYGHVETTS